jgi:hypothetical protein
MAWLEDVRNCVVALPREFSLNEIYRFSGYLGSRYPKNRNVPDQIRKQLQVLRDLGELEFLGSGTYRSRAERTSDWPLRPGDATSRAELAEILGLRGTAPLESGMFKPALGRPFGGDLLLFHQAGENPYGDRFSEDGERVFVGQGRAEDGDQRLERYNRQLAEQLDRGLAARLFVQEDSRSPTLRYEGEFVATDVAFSYRDNERRSVIEYNLTPANDFSAAAAYGAAYEHVLEERLEPHVVPVRGRERRIQEKIRDAAFRTHIRAIYGEQGAVCGPPLEAGMHRDLQAAHIRAFGAGGPDARNNGLCLCARHHWAFDHGAFTLDADLCLLLARGFEDPHGELIEGASVLLPGVEALYPHEDYLGWHRQTWQFS